MRVGHVCQDWETIFSLSAFLPWPWYVSARLLHNFELENFYDLENLLLLILF